MRGTGYDQAFTYSYSRREQTYAGLFFKDDVEETVKSKRYVPANFCKISYFLLFIFQYILLWPIFIFCYSQSVIVVSCIFLFPSDFSILFCAISFTFYCNIKFPSAIKYLKKVRVQTKYFLFYQRLYQINISDHIMSYQYFLKCSSIFRIF